MKKRAIKHNKTVIVSCIVLFIVISGLPTLGSVFSTEKSANRMLMWNVTTKAILNKPVTGTGLGPDDAIENIVTVGDAATKIQNALAK